MNILNVIACVKVSFFNELDCQKNGKRLVIGIYLTFRYSRVMITRRQILKGIRTGAWF